MVVDSTTTQPEKLDLPEISEDIKGNTRAELEALREELSTELAGDVTRLVTLCRHQKVAFERWKENPLSAQKIDEIRNTLEAQRSAPSNRFADSETSSLNNPS